MNNCGYVVEMKSYIASTLVELDLHNIAKLHLQNNITTLFIASCEDESLLNGKTPLM